MKKLFSALDYTPSVFFTFKGIYAFVFLISTTTLTFSQNSQWEFGVGLRPLTLKEEPYSLILKRHLSRHTALRFGASVIFTKQNEKYAFETPFADTPYVFRYNYELVDRKFFGTAFIGFQYGKRKNNLYWYGATDFSFKYKIDGKYFPEGNASVQLYSATFPTSELIIWSNTTDLKTINYGIRQSFGLQYFINQSISISLEAGIFYEINQSTGENYVRYGYRSIDRPIYEQPIIGSNISWIKDDTYLLGFSPLTFLSFNYHFN
jgi:hypothetical protein